MTDVVEELKAEATRLNAETAKLNAQTALLTAQAAKLAAEAGLAKAQPTLDALKREKELLEAVKARADAERSAAVSQAQARFGSVAPATDGGTGAITVNSGAGKAEAALLAARAYADGAEVIAARLPAEVTTIAVIPGGEGPTYPEYLEFMAKLEAIRSRLEPLLVQTPTTRAAMPGVPVLTSAGALLQAVSALGTYFRSDYQVGGLELEDDDHRLATAMSGALLKLGRVVRQPLRQVAQVKDLVDLLAPLKLEEAEVLLGQRRLGLKALRTEQAATDDESVKQELSVRIEEEAASLTQLEEVMKSVEEFVKDLSVKDAAGVPLIVKIMRGRAIHGEVASEVHLLFISAHDTAGSYYTKKNLWSFLGSMPFYVMGGAVIEYNLTGPDGSVKAAGLLPMHGGVRKVNAVLGFERLVTDLRRWRRRFFPVRPPQPPKPIDSDKTETDSNTRIQANS